MKIQNYYLLEAFYLFCNSKSNNSFRLDSFKERSQSFLPYEFPQSTKIKGSLMSNNLSRGVMLRNIHSCPWNVNQKISVFFRVKKNCSLKKHPWNNASVAVFFYKKLDLWCRDQCFSVQKEFYIWFDGDT